MAQALSSSFDEWIRSLLNDLQSNNIDMSDFVQYLLTIVTSDSETNEEKQIAITELLGELDLKHNHNINNLSQQILDRWYSCQDHPIDKSRVEQQNDDDIINTTFINAMNQIESTAKLQKQSNDKLDDDMTLRKHKSHILAKYSEVSDEEFDDEDETGIENNGYSENSLFRNTNTQDVEDRDKKIRELQQETHKKQQDKNKIDANNQKQKDDERKKKAQQRAQKQERRR